MLFRDSPSCARKRDLWPRLCHHNLARRGETKWRICVTPREKNEPTLRASSSLTENRRGLKVLVRRSVCGIGRVQMNNVGLGITLKKLSKQEGQWVLEVERMIPLGRALHQPTPQKIEGQALIGRHLRAVPELAAMAEATETLMLDESAEDCYAIWEGRWVDEEMVKVLAPGSPKGRKSAMGAAAPRTSGVTRLELSKLQQINDALVSRIANLEASNGNSLVAQFDQMSRVLNSFSSRLKTIEEKLGVEAPAEVEIPAVGAAGVAAATPPTPAREAPSGTPAKEAPSVEASDAESGEPGASAESPAVSEGEEEAGSVEAAANTPIATEENASGTPVAAAAEAEGEEAESSPSGEPEALEEEAAVDAAAAEEIVKPEKRMRIPKTGAMKQSMTILIGEDVGFNERDKKVDLSEGTFFRCTVLDDKETVIGLMIADVEATIRLSSILLMLTDSERDSQLKSGDATDDSIETMSEIFNTMSATINNMKVNPHVRVTPLAPMPPGEFQWPDTCKRRVDIDVEVGGIIVVCAI